MQSSFVSIGVQNRSNAEASDTLKEFSSFGFKTEGELAFHTTAFELNSISNNLKFETGIVKKSKHLMAILARLDF